jgi:hypothetical protein
MLEEQEGLGLFGTHQFAICADGVNLMDAEINSVKGKKELCV